MKNMYLLLVITLVACNDTSLSSPTSSRETPASSSQDGSQTHSDPQKLAREQWQKSAFIKQPNQSWLLNIELSTIYAQPEKLYPNAPFFMNLSGNYIKFDESLEPHPCDSKLQ